MEEQIPAFLFGKIRLATFYLNAGQYDACQDLLNELAEMGAGEHEEVAALRKKLEEIP